MPRRQATEPLQTPPGTNNHLYLTVDEDSDTSASSSSHSVASTVKDESLEAGDEAPSGLGASAQRRRDRSPETSGSDSEEIPLQPAEHVPAGRSPRRSNTRLAPAPNRRASQRSAAAKPLIPPLPRYMRDREARTSRKAAVRRSPTVPRPIVANNAAGLSTLHTAKVCALAYHCTHADALLALLGAGSVVCAKPSANIAQHRTVSSAANSNSYFGVVMRAMGDMGDLATICSNPRETYRAVKNLQAAANAMKRRATRAMRVAAAETFALGDGDHDPPRLVFMTCGDGLQTHDVCPRPEALHLADFVKLVFREDGSLNLGPCSLLELLASAWIQSFPESDLLLSERGEYCLTPAVLAGLLLEAEEMCTPPEEKRSLHDGGLPRLRETFDVHVRPLLSRVDGGGVLLPAARTATWLPGVDRLPMAFRAGKQGLPKSLRMAAHQARYDAGGGPIRERIR